MKITNGWELFTLKLKKLSFFIISLTMCKHQKTVRYLNLWISIFTDCSKIVEVIPKVVDKIVNNGLIRIVLTKSPSNLSNIVCSIKQNDNLLVSYI